MARKYTKDQLIKEVIKAHGRVCDLSSRFDNTIKQVNDNNVLHRLELANNTEALRLMTKVAKVIMWAFGSLFALIIIALIILAGAEKALNYWPSIISVFKP